MDSTSNTNSHNPHQKTHLERTSVPNMIKEITETLARAGTQPVDFNSISIAPKKANWDLKRDIAQKMERLENRTQRAVVEMMRERLEQSKGGQIESDWSQEVTVSAAKDFEDEKSSDED